MIKALSKFISILVFQRSFRLISVQISHHACSLRFESRLKRNIIRQPHAMLKIKGRCVVGALWWVAAGLGGKASLVGRQIILPGKHRFQSKWASVWTLRGSLNQFYDQVAQSEPDPSSKSGRQLSVSLSQCEDDRVVSPDENLLQGRLKNCWNAVCVWDAELSVLTNKYLCLFNDIPTYTH